MTLHSTPHDSLLTELDGQQIIPPLIRSPHGWIEQKPACCAVCEDARFLIGWTACACRADTLAPGHRTWACQTCGRYERLGCLDVNAQPGPMEEYGCRS